MLVFDTTEIQAVQSEVPCPSRNSQDPVNIVRTVCLALCWRALKAMRSGGDYVGARYV